MPILATAKQHFDQDMDRARGLFVHTQTLGPGILRDDIVRSAWMMGVGALDAFYCDAYADLVARTLQAKQLELAVPMPKRILNLYVPVLAVIRRAPSENWRWRIAAREIIEDQSVLSLNKIRELFNQFCRTDHKVLSHNVFKNWFTHRDAKVRQLGISKTDYNKLAPRSQYSAIENAFSHFEARYELIFQRRHDCIHNCDRPKIALDRQYLDSPMFVPRVLEDIEFLVYRTIEFFRDEYPAFIRSLGFSGITRNRVCA